jgi:cell shape-determining protein MreC|tara:strand:+ start:702 stop:821 length:120 start_codon:yes stop_codon:yes gene_type:complete
MEENLINGFDEIIAHIRKLEDEIKRLKQENRLLKERLDD